MLVLIVFENIPESTDLFIVDAIGKEVEDLKLSHNSYVNDTDSQIIDDAISRVNLRLGERYEGSDEQAKELGLPASDIGKWSKCKVTGSLPIMIDDNGIDMIVVTGFVM